MASYSISTRQKDKGWQVIVSYKDRYGKWRQKSKQGFATKRQAKDYGDVIVKDIKERLLLINNEEFTDITFIQFFRLYIDDLKDTLRANSLISYNNAIKHLHALHDVKLQNITPKMIYEIARDMPLSDKHKRYIFGLMKATFKHAITKYNLMLNNPVTITFKTDDTNKRKRLITDEELNQYYSTIDPNSRYYIAIKILECTGLRIGELLGLTWNDIEWEGMTISINKQWVRKGLGRNYGLGELKTKNSERCIPIPSKLVTALLECKKKATTERIVPITSPSRLYMHINTHINKHSPHDFRHTYATKLLSSGLDIKTVASLLGDKVETVINTYIHYSDEMRENARSEIQRIFD